MDFKELSRVIVQEDASMEAKKQVAKIIWDRQSENYHMVALIDLVMNYVVTVEAYAHEDLNKLLENEPQLLEAFNLVKHCVKHLRMLANDDAEKVIYTDQLKKTKKQLQERVAVLVAYNENIELFESVYKKMLPEAASVPEADSMSGDMLRFAFMDQDMYLINQRIKDILRIIPVRMTKDNRDDYVRKAMQVYYGCTINQMDSLVDQLKEAILPDRVSGYGDYFGYETGFIKDIKELKSISGKDQIDDILRDLDNLTVDLEVYLDICTFLTDLINRLIILFIGARFNPDQLLQREKNITNVYSILDVISKGEDVGDMVEEFTGLEGLPETWGYEVEKYQGLIEQLINADVLIGEVPAEVFFNDLIVAKKLNSSSLFASEDDEEDTSKQADAKLFSDYVESINTYMDDMFEHFELPIARQKFNQLMFTLPVPFKTPQEFHSFVKHGLQSCSNREELSYTWCAFKEIEANYNR